MKRGDRVWWHRSATRVPGTGAWERMSYWCAAHDRYEKGTFAVVVEVADERADVHFDTDACAMGYASVEVTDLRPTVNGAAVEPP